MADRGGRPREGRGREAQHPGGDAGGHGQRCLPAGDGGRAAVRAGAAAARAEGASENEARRAARLCLGSPTLILEDARDAFGFPRAEALLRDLSPAARRLRRAAGFTAASVVTLALGIGESSALFALGDAVLLRPLPYPEPERAEVTAQSCPLVPAGDRPLRRRG